MSNELTTIPDSRLDYAGMLAKSDMMPKHLRGKPSDVLWAIEYANALGVAPMTAFTSIHVIEGKPSASASLISALVRRAGHKLRVTGDDKQATAMLIRADDPDFEFSATWSIARAQQAGVTGKDNWRKYPGAMLKARAITEVCRMGAEDALLGLNYTPEELGADTDASGSPISQVAPVLVKDSETQRWNDAERVAFCTDLGRMGLKYEDVAEWCESLGRPRPSVMNQERRDALLKALGNGMRKTFDAWREKRDAAKAKPPVEDVGFDAPSDGPGCGVCGTVTALARGVCLDCASDPDKEAACTAAAAEWEAKR